MALQIQEVAPTDSRGGPHRVWCGTLFHVALCSEGMDSRGGPHRVVWHLVPFRITRQDSRKRDNHKSSISCWVSSDSMTRW